MVGLLEKADVFQASPSTGTLVPLAEMVLELSRKLESSIQAPTFQNDTLSNLDPQLNEVRKSLIDTSSVLNALARGALGPFGRVQTIAGTHHTDQSSLHFIYRFRIPHAVPLDDTISFTDLAAKVNVDELTLTRLLRHAMNNHFFCEPQVGYIGHTIDTRLLATDSTLFDYVGCVLEDLRPASLHLPDAIEKWPGSEEPNQTGFNVACNTDLPLYRYLMQSPERIRRASALMTQVTQTISRSGKAVAAAYPWQALCAGSTIVDVGGGNGHLSVALANEHPHLKFVVQDLPGVSAQGEKELPSELKESGRVSFMPHDFFQEQPLKDAAAFLFVNTMHTWSDKYVVQILKKLTPALQPGARVLICERALPEPGTAAVIDEKEIRTVDMYMMHNLNGRERSVQDFFNLFEKADERFRFRNTYKVEGTTYAICEAFWIPQMDV